MVVRYNELGVHQVNLTPFPWSAAETSLFLCYPLDFICYLAVAEYTSVQIVHSLHEGGFESNGASVASTPSMAGELTYVCSPGSPTPVRAGTGGLVGSIHYLTHDCHQWVCDCTGFHSQTTDFIADFSFQTSASKHSNYLTWWDSQKRVIPERDWFKNERCALLGSNLFFNQFSLSFHS